MYKLALMVAAYYEKPDVQWLKKTHLTDASWRVVELGSARPVR